MRQLSMTLATGIILCRSTVSLNFVLSRGSKCNGFGRSTVLHNSLRSSASCLPKARDWGWALQAWHDSPAATPAIPKLALIVLSTPLSASLLRRVWELTEKHIVADGGANVLHRARPVLVPDVLVGDLDSASAEAVKFFKAEGVDVRDLSSDQDTTDLEKALAVAESFSCEKVIVAGKFAGVAGRLDHTFGIFNALYKSLSRNLQVALEASMQFGQLVSTSNRIDPKKDGPVWVRTSSPVLWMCNFPASSRGSVEI